MQNLVEKLTRGKPLSDDFFVYLRDHIEFASCNQDRVICKEREELAAKMLFTRPGSPGDRAKARVTH
jgi:hypothetical protein